MVFLFHFQYEVTRPSVYVGISSVEILVELLSVHRENDTIFTKICTLIGLLAQDQETSKVSVISCLLYICSKYSSPK